MKYPDDFLNKVIQGDCLEVMKQMPDKCVDLVVTDPPYGIAYQGESRPNEKIYDKIENDNLEINYKELIRELQRIGKQVIIFGAENFYQDLPYKGRWICWDKRSEKLENEVLGSPFELAWTDKETGYYRLYRVIHGGFINADRAEIGQARVHPTQKPVRLMGKIIVDYTSEDEIILDPFLGSGTTAVAAKLLKRNYIGIEISEKYCKIAEERLRQEILL